jgi:hypothetical protein
MPAEIRPAAPVYVSGGKRLNFDRHDTMGELTDTFYGCGRDDGCFPSGSWAELCALASLVVAHPAYQPPEQLAPGAMIEDEDPEDPRG